MSHAPHAKQAHEIHPSTVLGEGESDGIAGLEQLPARPAADREQGDRLAGSEAPKARTRQTESILCRNLAQETHLLESDASRPVSASRAAGTEDHLDERKVLSPECKKDPNQPGRPWGPSHRVRADGDLGRRKKISVQPEAAMAAVRPCRCVRT